MNQFFASAVFGCAACGGDPSSLLSQGVVAGVLFLLGVVVFVLGAILLTAFSWSRRAKKIESSFHGV